MNTQELMEKIMSEVKQTFADLVYEYADGDSIVISSPRKITYDIPITLQLYNLVLSAGYNEDKAITACTEKIINDLKEEETA